MYRCPFPNCKKRGSWGAQSAGNSRGTQIKTTITTHTTARAESGGGGGAICREYVCQYPKCGKSFYDNQHLKQHYWIHTRNPQVGVSGAWEVGVPVHASGVR